MDLHNTFMKAPILASFDLLEPSCPEVAASSLAIAGNIVQQ
jgi:hypothetical protein